MMKPLKLMAAGSLLVLLGAGLIAATAGAGAARDQRPDVGLVTALKGAARYSPGPGQAAAPLKAFMKLRLGDRVSIPAGSRLQLVYFASGRREAWQGPSELIIGQRQSRARGPGQPKAVELLPTTVSRGVGKFASLVERAAAPAAEVRLGKAGGSVLRGKGGGAGQADPAAFALYQRLLRHSGPRDITPELYLLGELSQGNDWDAMETALQKALAKSPGNPMLLRLRKWVRAQKARQGKQ